jgi:hypothetical protein
MQVKKMDTAEITRTSFRDFLHVLFNRKIQIFLFFGATVCTVGIDSSNSRWRLTGRTRGFI